MFAAGAAAQQPPPAPADENPTCQGRGFMAPGANFDSVEVLPDRRVTFRICAPEAHAVRVTSSDAADVIPMGLNGPAGLPMTKDATGLWSVTTPTAFAPDTYRFRFQVDGAPVPDPRGDTYSRERTGLSSTLEVPGPEGQFQTYVKDEPHGVVSTIEYWSDALGQKREAHVYTPPGYMKDGKSYPVLYLVHGAGDHHDSWTSVGQAHHILDNLIAAGKAQKMIIVMPFGHTPPRAGADMLANKDFGNDLIGSLIPYVDANFRTVADADHRAMAGLSMGGSHTLNFGLPHPDLFHYIGIFSMGIGLRGPEDVTRYEAEHGAELARAAKEMKLVYYAMGKDDFLYASVEPTRGMMNKAGIKHIYNESQGGHTWINWRRYFQDFAPRLFNDAAQ